nr:MAG TPA: hypothetical protein [Caudoviricetes sp.]DAL72026.1 MAG TPA: hypothetical protein [Caudoviricetes sp.]
MVILWLNRLKRLSHCGSRCTVKFRASKCCAPRYEGEDIVYPDSFQSVKVP